MKDVVENRRHISLAHKLRIAQMVVSQNGVAWCMAFALYYFTSSISNRAHAWMSALRVRKGLPGLNSLELNRVIWNTWDWSRGGEEWTADEAWKQSLTRHFLERYVPKGAHVLEIGPGGGRWTAPLLARADAYVGVDVSSTCIDTCRQRFSRETHARFIVGSGVDLAGVETNTIDVLWSFDVFVHINETEVSQYVQEFARVLKPGGTGIVHHGTVAGLKGGWRSNLTQARMIALLSENGFEIVESVGDWTDAAGKTFTVSGYDDRLTVFRKVC